MVDSVSSGVDSYQIPVPNGDCAFHFLVDRSQGVGNFVIEKAIIVDGGRGADEACKVIKDTLAQLQDDKYGKRDIVFDYWLVTHWDEDHYAGALEYFDKLDDEKRKQFKGVYGPVSVSKEELGMENKDHQQKFLERFPEDAIQYKIGQDFFNEGKQYEASASSFDNWWESISKKTHVPSFICIAAYGKCLQLGGEPFTDQHLTRNSTSAFFVTTWAAKTTDIWYYAAGDGNMKIEEYLVENGFFKRKAQQYFIRTLVAKGTHHGAFNAFNEKFFKAMSPENYVVSAGEQFGHPTLALLLKIATLSEHTREPKTILYTSRYPYYLREEAETTKQDLNIETVMKVMQEAKKAKEAKKDKEIIEEETEVQTTVDRLTEQLRHLKQTKGEHWMDTAAKDPTVKDHLDKLWKELSGSEVPDTTAKEERPYRIEMSFFWDEEKKESIVEIDVPAQVSETKSQDSKTKGEKLETEDEEELEHGE